MRHYSNCSANVNKFNLLNNPMMYVILLEHFRGGGAGATNSQGESSKGGPLHYTFIYRQ